MKRLTATLCLTIAVLLGSAGAGYALPPCPGSPLTEWTTDYAHWRNYIGTKTWAGGSEYVGKWKDGQKQ